MSAFLVAALSAFVWWVQRDAYRAGRKMGRLEERRAMLEREFARQQAEKGEHLRVVR